MTYGVDGEWKPMVGRTVTKLEISDIEESDSRQQNGQYIRFTLDDGSTRLYITEGDCCSSTWIQTLSGVSALLGHAIYKIESVEMPDAPDGDNEYEVLQDYGVKFETAGGYFDIIYRNSSNGYYGGTLELVDPVAPDGYRSWRDYSLDGTELWRDITADYEA